MGEKVITTFEELAQAYPAEGDVNKVGLGNDETDAMYCNYDEDDLNGIMVGKIPEMGFKPFDWLTWQRIQEEHTAWKHTMIDKMKLRGHSVPIKLPYRHVEKGGTGEEGKMVQVYRFLEGIGLKGYARNFYDLGVNDLTDLKEIKKEDLDEMEINPDLQNKFTEAVATANKPVGGGRKKRKTKKRKTKIKKYKKSKSRKYKKHSTRRKR